MLVFNYLVILYLLPVVSYKHIIKIKNANRKYIDMKSLNHSMLKIFTLLGLVCMSVPLSIYGLWLYVIDLGTTHAERVAIFKEYFPEFLNGRWGTTFLSIVFCILAIIFSSISLKLSGKLWKVLNIIILVLSSLLLLLNIFSMM